MNNRNCTETTTDIDVTNKINNCEQNEKYKCKSCSAEFETLQTCLSHELTHINLTEGRGGKQNNNNNNRRKRKKSKPTKTKIITATTTSTAVADDTPEKRNFQNSVIKLLSECPEGSELNYLCRIFQPMPEDISLIYQSIYVDLNADLMRTGQQWQIIPFGSTIMGMAFKESDIDFYVYPWGEDSRNSDRIYHVVTSIFRRSKRFSNLITIPKARVPIIKCTHNVTGYNLDLNVSSVLGVHSSQFVAKLFNLDSRIHPFMLIIKIWAKCWNLSGTGRMTNYCLTLLVIVYLQSLQPPILPSIKELQQNTDELLVKGINYAFNHNYRTTSPKNEQNIKEIVEGFFKFYSELDFGNNIICPYLGKVISRQDFITKKFQFPEYDRLLEFLQKNYPPTNIKRELHREPIKLHSPIVIQDPFCLNHNNSSSIGRTIFDLFKFHLLHAHKICTEFPTNSNPTTTPMTTTASTSKNQRPSQLLIRLLFEKPTSETVKLLLARNQKQAIQQQNITTPSTPSTLSTPSTPIKLLTKVNPKPINQSIESNSTDGTNTMIFRISPIEAELLYVRTYLRKTFPQQSFNKIEVNQFWTEKIIEYTKEILSNIFKIQLIDDFEIKNVKVLRSNAEQTDVHNSLSKNSIGNNDENNRKFTMNYELKGTIDTWSNRKNEFKRGYSAYLQEQIDITKSFETTRNEETFPGNLHCKLTLKPDNDFSVLTLTLEDLSLPKFLRAISGVGGSKSNLKLFFTQYTSRMRYFYRAYFEKLAKATTLTTK